MQGRSEEFLTAGPRLVAEMLERVGHVRFRAHGTSMLPAIQSGDVLTVDACQPAGFQVGDVVVFVNPNGLVAHRLVATRGHGRRAIAVTRGDGNWQIDLPTPMVRLLGRVSRVTRGGAPQSLAQRCSWIDRGRGLLRNESLRVVRRLRTIAVRAARQKCRSHTAA